MKLRCIDVAHSFLLKKGDIYDGFKCSENYYNVLIHIGGDFLPFPSSQFEEVEEMTGVFKMKLRFIHTDTSYIGLRLTCGEVYEASIWDDRKNVTIEIDGGLWHGPLSWFTIVPDNPQEENSMLKFEVGKTYIINLYRPVVDPENKWECVWADEVHATLRHQNGVCRVVDHKNFRSNYIEYFPPRKDYFNVRRFERHGEWSCVYEGPYTSVEAAKVNRFCGRKYYGTLENTYNDENGTVESVFTRG